MTRTHARPVLAAVAAIPIAIGLPACTTHREGVGRVVPASPVVEEAPGDVPPSDRWIGTRREPPSRPDRTRSGWNVRVNQDASGQDQNETVLSVSPSDPLNLIAGANDYRVGHVQCGYYASRDGGLTWSDGVLTGTPYPYQGDPAVAHCADGSAIYVCLSFVAPYQPHGLFAYRTGDDGQTFSGPFTVLQRPSGFPFADKPWVGCDRNAASPYANRVYATWTDFDLRATIELRYSTNGGQTWSVDVPVSDGGNTQASVIAIGRYGSVNVAWEDATSIGFDRSTDGGVSFGADRFPSGMVNIPDDPVFRRNSYPTMDVDRTMGAHAGNLYIAWADGRNGDADILMVRSPDHGASWSPPVRVNDDTLGNGRDQFFPWLAVDPEGRVVVTFFDRRRDLENRDHELWGAISRDGGQTFDTNFLIAEAPSNGDLNDFIGDYSGLAVTSDRIHPIWTDLRAGTGESDAYTDRFPNTFRYDEVQGARWFDEDTLDFQAQDPRFRVAVDYDVVSGLLSELSADAGFSRAECASARWADPPYVDERIPPAGDGFYFLVRAHGPTGVGTYGDGSPGRPNVRDPLDETLALCP